MVVGCSGMKLIFNGILEQQSGGCVPCGRKRSSSQKMMTSKTFILPSGATRTFLVGKEEEVTDSDGEFLLTYTYTDKQGHKQQAFTEVK